MKSVRVFRYVQELDAFLVTDEFSSLSDRLGLTEWHPVVWVGRLFTMDNDVGEHWFDNWDERDALKRRAKELGIDPFNLMIIKPDRFMDGRDGPCHTPEIRKAFWTDVLKSLELSYDLLFKVARLTQAEIRKSMAEGYMPEPGEYIPDLEERIALLHREINDAT